MGDTLGETVTAYLAARRPDLAYESYRNISYTLGRFVAVVGADLPVGLLDETDVDRWRQSLPRGLAPRTKRHEFGRLKEFTRWAARHGFLGNDPCMALCLPKNPRSEPRELETVEVVKAGLVLPDVRARLIVSLMFFEGLRCCEVARLEVDDVDGVRRQLHIVGKGGHRRIVPLSEQTAATLRAYLDVYPAPAGPLVRSYRTGGSLSAKRISEMVVGWLRDAGVKRAAFDGKSAHAYRHAAAGAMLDAGADIRDVKDFLGHVSLAVTAQYLKRRSNMDRLREAMDRRAFPA